MSATLTPWRANMLAQLEAVVGLSADPNGGTADRYSTFLAAPGDTVAMRAAELTMSSCELAVLGELRADDMEDPILAQPYVVGTAGVRLRAIAEHKGAWMPPDTTPQPGDIVVVGGSAALGGYEHAFAVETVDVDADGVVHVGSVDGGQRDANGFECIARCERRFVDGWDCEDGGARTRRKIVAVIDLDQLFLGAS